ncbi:hypothetical protein [Nocardia mangyaensis]|nr:hypothetical protein [Nocardia mangyaensis]
MRGTSAAGSVDACRAYIDHQHRHYAIDHVHWDWTVPDDWYGQANS